MTVIMSDVITRFFRMRGKRDWLSYEAKLFSNGLLFVWISSILLHSLCQGETSKFCFDGKANSTVQVRLSCMTGEVLSLGEAILVWNKFDACIFTKEDCTEKTEVFETHCEGQPNCSVVFPPSYLATCGNYAVLVGLSYDCIVATVKIPATITASGLTSTVAVGSEGSNSSRKTTTTDSYQQMVGAGSEATSSSDSDSIALIVGCVLAVIITVVLLIIAIVMVVRRLTCSVEQAADDVEKKPTPCSVLPCTTIGGSDDPGEGIEACPGDQTCSDTVSIESGSDVESQKRKQCCLTSERGRNRQSLRLAPVGQEDELGVVEGSSGAEPERFTGKSSRPELPRSAKDGRDRPARPAPKDKAAALAADSDKYANGCLADDRGGRGGGGSSGETPKPLPASPLVAAANRAVKRHSSGARIANGDHFHHSLVATGNCGSRHEQLVKGGAADHSVSIVHGSKKTDSGSRVSVPAAATASTSGAVGDLQGPASKPRLQYDAVALPNTEAVSSC